MLVTAAKLIGAGVATVGLTGAGIGIGISHLYHREIPMGRIRVRAADTGVVVGMVTHTTAVLHTGMTKSRPN